LKRSDARAAPETAARARREISTFFILVILCL
jgi:outer membrane murein-binding lipoprotein Lpp